MSSLRVLSLIGDVDDEERTGMVVSQPVLFILMFRFTVSLFSDGWKHNVSEEEPKNSRLWS